MKTYEEEKSFNDGDLIESDSEIDTASIDLNEVDMKFANETLQSNLDSIKKEYYATFKLVNWNYFINKRDDTKLGIFDEKFSQIFQNQSTMCRIIYKIINCCILKPIGLIQSAIAQEKIDFVEGNDRIDVIILELNALNQRRIDDVQYLMNRIEGFEIRIGQIGQSKLCIQSKMNTKPLWIDGIVDRIFLHSNQFEFFNQIYYSTKDFIPTVVLMEGDFYLVFIAENDRFGLKPIHNDRFHLEIIYQEYSIDLNSKSISPNCYEKQKLLNPIVMDEPFSTPHNDLKLKKSIKSPSSCELVALKHTDNSKPVQLSKPKYSISIRSPSIDLRSTRRRMMMIENESRPNSILKSKFKTTDRIKSLISKNHLEENTESEKDSLNKFNQSAFEIDPQETKIMKQIETQTKKADFFPKARQSLIVVNKINLNQLDQTPSIIPLEHSSDEIFPLNIPDTEEIRELKTEPRHCLDRSNHRQSNHSLRTLIKLASFDIEKSVRYLRYLNDFVDQNRKNFHIGNVIFFLNFVLKLQ